MPADQHSITGIIHRYIDPVDQKIAGISYSACMGHTHPRDGKEIRFDAPIVESEIPSPWRELLLPKAETSKLDDLGPATTMSLSQTGLINSLERDKVS
jgi:hypothetical protein